MSSTRISTDRSLQLIRASLDAIQSFSSFHNWRNIGRHDLRKEANACTPKNSSPMLVNLHFSLHPPDDACRWCAHPVQAFGSSQPSVKQETWKKKLKEHRYNLFEAQNCSSRCIQKSSTVGINYFDTVLLVTFLHTEKLGLQFQMKTSLSKGWKNGNRSGSW